MPKFRVEWVEEATYIEEVEAEDEDEALGAAQDMATWAKDVSLGNVDITEIVEEEDAQGS